MGSCNLETVYVERAELGDLAEIVMDNPYTCLNCHTVLEVCVQRIVTVRPKQKEEDIEDLEDLEDVREDA